MALFDGKDDMGQGRNRATEWNTAALTDEERLSAKMAELEDEQRAVFAEIGKEYYDMNPEDLQSETMQDNFREAGELGEQIRDINNQIRTLKGITTCEHCGADILVTDTFCASCGARILEEITVSPVGGICPSCGRKVNPGQMFCSTCGTKITVSESVEDEIMNEATRVYEVPEDGAEQETSAQEPADGMPAEEAPAGEAQAAGGKRICTNCGRELEDGVQFCMFCGKPVETPFADDGFPMDSEPAPAPEPGASGRFCMNCGAPLEPGDVFCINCGQKVE